MLFRSALPERLLPAADLRGNITGRRTILFSEAAEGDTFFVDGRAFDPTRIDTRVKLDAIEEWTMRNESGELHDFHIHQTHFWVTEVNGVPQRFDGYQDIVNVPVHGEVKVIIPPSSAQVDGWIGAASLELTDADLDEIAGAIKRTGAGTGPVRP